MRFSFWLLVVPLLCWTNIATQAADPVDFAKDVAPILQQHCIRCHNTKTKKGDFSLATEADVKTSGYVVPNKPDVSVLMKVVQTAKGESRPQMPKQAKPLNENEIAVLHNWIHSGAKWPANFELKERARADANWWSLQPLKKIEPPKLANAPEAWTKNPIDRFIFAALQQNKLQPNPPADRAALIRRVTYDLTGLPATPADVEAFVNDKSENAFEKLVDQLLASKQYGEHWGRHWLDVARFGESNGYERNILTNTLWPYRDYVIKSFNEDKPFNQFILEQIAGDTLTKDDPDKLLGTAFLVCGPYDNVGNSDAAAAAVIQANHTDEIIRATSEAFLGWTFGCARCHDHKFDPISQKDYYAWSATFNGVYHAERALPKKEPHLPAKVWIGYFDNNSAKSITNIWVGGDPQKKGEAVVPSSPEVLAKMKSHYTLDKNSSESERRAALAQWIASDDNPLTPRVLANRIWHFHFGTGIVDSPSDFGWMGSPPSHPDLLDWLAGQVIEAKWKWKPIHKQILMSQTYQQSAAWRAEAGKVDAAARLLWRFPPRRLNAEELRDTMLSVAGKLDLNAEKGGAGFRLYKYVQDNVATYYPLDKHGPDTYRRAVYHQNARAARVDVLSDFDCPDPAAAAPKRATTTTPLQALALMNHSFTHDMSKFMAARLTQQAGEKIEAQVRLAFMLSYNRAPNAEEMLEATTLVKKHGLPPLCFALLNSNEMLFLK